MLCVADTHEHIFWDPSDQLSWNVDVVSRLAPAASNASAKPKILHLPPFLLSHFRNAHINAPGNSDSPLSSLVRKTTEAGGTNGRSSNDAIPILYSCENNSPARNEADLVERRCGGGERLCTGWMLSANQYQIADWRGRESYT